MSNTTDHPTSTRPRDGGAPVASLVSSLGHTLRTPLGQASGFAQILSEGLAGDLTEAQLGYLAKLTRGVDELSSLINDLVSVADWETGRASLEPGPCDVLAILLGELQTLGDSVGTDLTHTLHYSSSCSISADESWISRMFRATATAGLALAGDQLPLHRVLTAGDGLRISTTLDAGPSFEAVHAAHSGTGLDGPALERACHGFGLRLSLASHVACAHGGALTLKCDRSGDTRVRIEVHVPSAS